MSKLAMLFGRFTGGAVVALALLVGSPAYAAPTSLSPGATALSLNTDPFVAGNSVLFGNDSFSSLDASSFSGVLYWGLWTNIALNPYGSDKLTFYYSLKNDSTSVSSLDRLTITGFQGFQTSVGLDGCAGWGITCIDAVTADRSANGDVIGWDFLSTNPVTPGDYSRDLVIYTDATNFGGATYNVIDGSVAVGSTIAPIPEPEVYAMLAAGLGLMGFVARRRKKSESGIV